MISILRHCCATDNIAETYIIYIVVHIYAHDNSPACAVSAELHDNIHAYLLLIPEHSPPGKGVIFP